MDDQVRHVLRAGTQMEYGKNLRTWVDSQPQYVLRATQSGAQFVQLEVRETKIREGALVDGLSVLDSAGQPGGDGSLSVAEDPLGGGSIQSTSRVQTAPLRSGEREFSDGTGGCGAGQ